MSVLWEFQRKFKEFKGLLTTELHSNLQSSEIYLELPILREPNFINILSKFLNFFKNKTKFKDISKKTENSTKQKISRIRGFSNKNYYSLTVSRKSSAMNSNDNRNDEEFFEAFDDLEDLLIHQQESSLNNSHIIPESQINENFKLKNTNKANKILSYFKEKEINLVQLQNFFEFHFEVHCPKITIEV